MPLIEDMDSEDYKSDDGEQKKPDERMSLNKSIAK